MSAPSTREIRHARTRQEILLAALDILNEEGPAKLSLREVARRVDYSPAGLYEYFDSKEDLINAVCAEGDRRLRTYLQAVSLELHPEEYLIELGLAYIRYARENSDHFLLNTSRLFPDRPIAHLEEIPMDDTFMILMNGVERAIEAGVFDLQEGAQPLDIAYSLWSLGHGMATLQLTNLKNLEYDYARVDRETITSFMRGLQNR
jgi:AcrR family transcriptional regulator